MAEEVLVKPVDSNTSRREFSSIALSLRGAANRAPAPEGAWDAVDPAVLRAHTPIACDESFHH